MQTQDELTNLLRQRTWDRELILWFGPEVKLRPFLTSVQVETLDLLDTFDPAALPVDDEEVRQHLSQSLFDRSWELLSPVLPVALIKPLVRGHFARQVPYIVYKNISRLTSQWEESINTALLNMGKEAERRLDELILTVERLIEGASRDMVPAIRQDLDRIASARTAIEHLEETI